MGVLKDGLPDNTGIVFKGSSVTGRSSALSKVPNSPFDFGRISDYDIAIINDDLYLASLNSGFKVKTMPDRIGPLKDEQVRLLGLSDLQGRLSQQAGRPVEFMLYDNLGDALSGPSHLVKIGEQQMHIYDHYGVVVDGDGERVAQAVGAAINVHFSAHESAFWGEYFLANLEKGRVRLIPNFHNGEWQEDEYRQYPWLLEVSEVFDPDAIRNGFKNVDEVRFLYRSEVEERKSMRRYELRNGGLCMISEFIFNEQKGRK